MEQTDFMKMVKGLIEHLTEDNVIIIKEDVDICLQELYNDCEERMGK